MEQLRFSAIKQCEEVDARGRLRFILALAVPSNVGHNNIFDVSFV